MAIKVLQLLTKDLNNCIWGCYAWSWFRSKSFRMASSKTLRLVFPAHERDSESWRRMLVSNAYIPHELPQVFQQGKYFHICWILTLLIALAVAFEVKRTAEIESVASEGLDTSIVSCVYRRYRRFSIENWVDKQALRIWRVKALFVYLCFCLIIRLDKFDDETTYDESFRIRTESAPNSQTSSHEPSELTLNSSGLFTCDAWKNINLIVWTVRYHRAPCRCLPPLTRSPRLSITIQHVSLVKNWRRIARVDE